ncbi:MAG: amidohydrolase [Firmicutes bacterium]|nr:amidohydrolase [Bacillota bacterium]
MNNTNTADLAFINGQVITVDPQNRVVQALAVTGNKISRLGSTEEIKTLIGPQTRVIDLKGSSLLPGLIDSHLHMAIQGSNEMNVNCKFPRVKSIEDIKNEIREAARKTPPGQWIRGWGYDQSKLAEKRHPTRWDLDEAAPHHPVMLIRTCAHISVNNSKSIELAGIDDHTPDPPGGVMEREGGRLNGVMKEAAHMNMLKAAAYSEQELIDSISLAGSQFARMGLTSVHDAGAYGPVQMKALQEAVRQGLVKTRIYAMVFSLSDNLAFVNNFLKSGFFTGFGDERLRIGCLKVMVDGSSSGPTAATRRPYNSNPADSGILSMAPEEVDDIFLRAHAAGFQVTAHAVGDRAVEMVINAIQRAREAIPRPNPRHRIEHCAMVDPQLIARLQAALEVFFKTGVGPVDGVHPDGLRDGDPLFRRGRPAFLGNAVDGQVHA